jgi:hypothetical protein
VPVYGPWLLSLEPGARGVNVVKGHDPILGPGQVGMRDEPRVEKRDRDAASGRALVDSQPKRDGQNTEPIRPMAVPMLAGPGRILRAGHLSARSRSIRMASPTDQA